MIDLTSDSVTPQTLLAGATAHDKSGAPISGAIAVAPPSPTTPKMDGTAAVGTETAYARGDHVHPSDASKADMMIFTQDQELTFSDIEAAVAANKLVFIDVVAGQLYPLTSIDLGMETAVFGNIVTAMNYETGIAETVELDQWFLRTDENGTLIWEQWWTTLRMQGSADFSIGDLGRFTIESVIGESVVFTDEGNQVKVTATDSEGNIQFDKSLAIAAPIQTQGNWRYKVYADGTFEAWYKATGQSLTITAQSGNLYRSDAQTITLPTNMTSGKTCNILHVSVNASHNNYPAWGMLASIQTPTANTFKYYAMSGGSRTASPNYLVTAYVFGTLE